MDLNEIFNKIGFDVRMAIFNSINFLIFFLILNKFVFGKVSNILLKREEEIKGSLENAEKIENQLKNVNIEVEEKIKIANQEANEIIKRSNEEQVAIASKHKAETQKEIDKMMKEAKSRIEREKEDMIKSLQQDTAQLALSATEQLLKEKMDEKNDKEYVNKFLKDLEIKA